MSARSKFERDFSPAIRAVSWALKIPDCSRAKKPFDYVIGIGGPPLNFRAIEAKKADGWTLGASKWEPHQRTALRRLAAMDENSAWVAIGFLDLPYMVRGPDRKKLELVYPADAFLIRWVDLMTIEVNGVCRYADISGAFQQGRLTWGTLEGRKYPSWQIRKTHFFLQKT